MRKGLRAQQEGEQHGGDGVDDAGQHLPPRGRLPVPHGEPPLHGPHRQGHVRVGHPAEAEHAQQPPLHVPVPDGAGRGEGQQQQGTDQDEQAEDGGDHRGHRRLPAQHQDGHEHHDPGAQEQRCRWGDQREQRRPRGGGEEVRGPGQAPPQAGSHRGPFSPRCRGSVVGIGITGRAGRRAWPRRAGRSGPRAGSTGPTGWRASGRTARRRVHPPRPGASAPAPDAPGPWPRR